MLDLFEEEKTRWNCEVIAEYTRWVSGFASPDWELRKSEKELPIERYGAESAYFHYLLTEKFPGYTSKLLNSFYNKQRYSDFLPTITDKTEKELWKEFQKELP
jgi:hypothetical protein